MIKTIEIKEPLECPLNNYCQCGLYGKLEGEQADKCPVNNDFPPLCPLNIIIKRHGIGDKE